MRVYFIRGGLSLGERWRHVLVNLVWHTDCSADRLVNEQTAAGGHEHHAIMSRLGLPNDKRESGYAGLGAALFTLRPNSRAAEVLVSGK